jgi:hypothetical protein
MYVTVSIKKQLPQKTKGFRQSKVFDKRFGVFHPIYDKEQFMPSDSVKCSKNAGVIILLFL